MVPSAPCETRANGFFIVASSTFLTFETCCWCCRPSGSGGRHVKGEHVKDAAQDGSVKVLRRTRHRTGGVSMGLGLGCASVCGVGGEM